jgi:hypothetical protein
LLPLSLVIIGTWIATPRGIKQKLLEGIFSSGPAAVRRRLGGRRHDLGAATICRRGCGVGAQLA